ncbi:MULTISPECIES: group 1 truncated hemoglobin [Ramlibacter]|uniref:Group 1 truncated hemoglobin n=1 Tax=Ramlibacter aquaticus TaxID=2780094 RepID=A0ABR9SFU1_9BURK|nr:MULTISPECIES: group 1 truncated hemoglobin [Ramlibacter]MBE7941217.1 group 1 truncated hemoglobin [Ramlibacter aquaticus]
MHPFFKHILAAAALGASLLAPLAASAQSADASLYQHLGEKPGIERLMNDFVTRLAADARTGPFFAKANLPHLKEQLTDQVCQVSGGPCEYGGADMKTAHADMDIRKGDFNALVEVLEQAMDAQGIAFADQRQLLARLAPMHRDVITVR